MKNLRNQNLPNVVKLGALAGLCFAMIVFGACSGGGSGSGGKYTGTVTVNGTAYDAASRSAFTVTNGITYINTGTSTEWTVYTGTNTSTSTTDTSTR